MKQLPLVSLEAHSPELAYLWYPDPPETTLPLQIHPRQRIHRGFLSLALLLTFTLPAPSADEKKIAVFSPAATYSISVVDREGREYAGLLEALEPLGQVSARIDGLHWTLRYNQVEAEFTANKKRARVAGHDFDLPANFLLENGRGLVPVAALNYLLPRILGMPVNFNPAVRRFFIGNIAVHFTAQINRTTPPRLVMNFTSPVNPTIATEPGRLRMSFNRQPLVAPGTNTLTFDDREIPSATYSESNGVSEISVNGTVPLMASFSNDGRTITIAPAPLQAAPALRPPATAATPSASGSVPASAPAGVPSTVPQPARHFYAVIDAAHGGDDRGAAFNDRLVEKDVTLAVARRLRQELESRGISTLTIRDSDATLTLDQRAIFANTAHPVVYIALHASSSGRGARIYTALLPAGGENNGPFVSWDRAQSTMLGASQVAAQGVAAEFNRRLIQTRTLPAPLRPLNNVTSAAIAVEVAPPGNDVMDLALPAYQQNIASAVANGIAAVRDKLGAPQ
jgi:N-acetylmuramoyl-L-alanine amidase